MSLDNLGEIEKSKEIESLYERSHLVNERIYKAQGNVLKTTSPEDIQKHLYEWSFLQVALFQLEAMNLRLKSIDDYESQKDYIDWASNWSGICAEIRENGTWGRAKDEFVKASIDTEHELEDAPKLGLEPNMSFNGVTLFANSEDDDEYGTRIEAWRRLAESKMDLIPDTTPPYKHPSPQELQEGLPGS